MAVGLAPEQFEGSERFRLQRCLGSGSMGIVYEAWDNERGMNLALKVMQRIDPRALFRFKREFRALADVSHPHLVTLYELLSEDEHWFFTMELVRGVSFLEYVRPWQGDADSRSLDARSISRDAGSWVWDEETREPHPTRAPRGFVGALDEARLRRVLPQLVQGIMALHAAKRLHRDIKPSNVLVTRKGRVAVCDFGLVGELEVPERGVREEARLVGTVNFMSPEQSRRGELTPASDWYSLGVMLYLALVGSLPFRGAEREILRAKRSTEPPAPGDVAADVAPDLNALCMELLARDPEARPTGNDILARLGSSSSTAVAVPDADLVTQFVGRRQELKELYAAYAEAREQGAVVTLVQGPTGMGKSALVDRFLEKVDATKNALVLEGRCHERESVPYKLFDSLMDGLSTRLVNMRGRDALPLLPEGSAAMSRLFPVMTRMAAVAPVLLRQPALPDPREERRRAFGAVRDLVTRLAQRQPVVLYVDDAQWGDVDSAELLLELVRGPKAPPVLVVLAYRTEDAAGSPFLEALSRARLDQRARVRRVTVGALADAEATRIASGLGGHDIDALGIAREAKGSPFLVRELTRYVAGGGAVGTLSLRSMLEARVKGLPSRARRILELVAVAGRPVEQRVVKRASGMRKGFERALTLLRNEHLVRTAGVRAHDRVESYHDAIRELIVGTLDADALRGNHEELAEAFHWAEVRDPEALVEHWLGAGHEDKAAVQAAVAAERAHEALAFDRAARLYATALELGTWSALEARAMTLGRARALAAAGRSTEAAETFLRAVPGAEPHEALQLRRLAAEKLLQSGHFERGTREMSSLLSDVGEPMPPTGRRLMLSFLAKRARIRLGGYRFKETSATRIAPDTLTRIDTMWAASSGLSHIDTMLGMEFQARHVLHALSAGEPYRVARSLAMEAGLLAAYGTSTYARTARMGKMALDLGKRIDNAHAIGFAEAALGVAEFLAGHFGEARRRLAGAREVLRSRCTEVQWELDSSLLFELSSMYFMGEMKALATRVPEELREAEARGDLFLETGLRSWRTNTLWLVADDPAEASRQLDTAASRWTRTGFHVQHYYELLARVQILLYEGRGAEGVRRRGTALGRPSPLASFARAEHTRRDALPARTSGAGGRAGCRPLPGSAACGHRRPGGPCSPGREGPLVPGAGASRGGRRAGANGSRRGRGS